jgi:hypothetical protein
VRCALGAEGSSRQPEAFEAEFSPAFTFAQSLIYVDLPDYGLHIYRPLVSMPFR